MNTKSKKEMKKLLKEYCIHFWNDEAKIADFGSYNVNGTYKSIIPENWKYTGVDTLNGPNVDVIINDDYYTYITKENFDVVISGGTLEHCKNPLMLVREMARVLVIGGIMIINAPQKLYEHGTRAIPEIRYKDYWRFNPEGLELLLETAGLMVLKSYIMKRHKDTYSMIVGRK